MSDNQHINTYLLIMDHISSLAKFRNPFGNQEIEIQEVVYEGGGTPMMRLRIRERGARFTIFDIDPVTAKYWADEMLKWATPLAEAGGNTEGS
jgi:type II secretory pathway component HofQ